MFDVLAQRPGMDQKIGGMEVVVRDIQNCYTQLSNDVSLKQCIALDMAGKHEDDLYSKNTGTLNLNFC